MAKMELRLVNKNDFHLLQARIDQFTSIENMQVIEHVFLPKIDKFISCIDRFEGDILAVK
jgi:hypothetical protein